MKIQKISNKIVLVKAIIIVVAYSQYQQPVQNSTINKTVEVINETIKELQIGDSLSEMILKKDSMKYYKVNIKQKLANEDFVVITSKYEQGVGDPDIYLSTKVQYPNTLVNPDIKGCYSIYYDICILQENEFKEGDTIYIGIYCYSKCSYNIDIRYQTETNVTLGDEVLEYFGSSSHTKLFKVYIPKNATTLNYNNNKPIGHIGFYIIPIDALDLNSTFNLYVKKGNQIPTTSDYDLKASPSWESGKSVSIYKNSSLFFCTDCEYKILVEAPSNSLMIISAYSKSEIISINLNNFEEDSIDSYGTIIYKLDIHNDKFISSDILKSSNLVFELEPYSGILELYIHPDTLPTKIKDYQWKIVEQTKTQFILTPQERLINNATDQVYYIAIQSVFSGTFSFGVSLKSKNTIQYIDFGVTESEQLEPNESIIYTLPVSQKNDTEITLNLIHEIGKAELYIIYCNQTQQQQQQENNCELNQEIISNFHQEKDKNKLIKYDSIQQFYHEEEIKFTFNHSSCTSKHKNNIQFCQYLIGVYCNATCLYQLSVHQKGQHILLKEGETLKIQLHKGDIKYYVFSLGNLDNQTTSVRFNLNMISGSTRMYISRKTMYPTITNCEKFTLFQTDQIDYTYDEYKDSIVGPYYIAIDSRSYATLSTLSVSVFRKSKTNSNGEISKRIHLYKNTPISQTLKKINQKAQFYFDLKLPKTFKGQIIITLTPWSGSFDLYISNNSTLLDSNISQWKTSGDFQNDISITYTDQNFKRKGRYYIDVVVEDNFINEFNELMHKGDNDNDDNDQEEEEDNTGDFRFEIEYKINEENYTQQTIEEITEKRSKESILDTNQTKTYYIKVDPHLNKLTLILYTLADYAVIQTYSHIDKGKAQHLKEGQNDIYSIIQYNSSEIQEICKRECKVYANISNPHNHMIFYIFQIQMKDTYTLQDGKPLQILLPNNSEHVHLLYTPTVVFNGISITATSQSGDIVLLLKSYDITKFGQNQLNSTNQIQFPNSINNSDFSSIHQTFTTSQSIFINPHDLTCSINCIFAITLLQSNDSNNNIIQPLQRDIITIVASTELQQLREGEPAHGYVVKDAYKYYIFKVPKKITNIFITLNSLSDGDPDMFILFGQNQRPTKYNFTWASQKIFGDYIEISKDNFPHFNQTHSMIGSYIIGVYAYTDTSFSLTVTFSNHAIINLQAGFPFDLNLHENKTYYFRYFHYVNESFTINAIKDSGSLNMYVNTFDNDNENTNQQNLPNETNSFWQNGYQNTTAYVKDYIRINQHDIHYCTKCNYLIRLTTDEQIRVKGTLNINVNNEYQFLQTNKPFSDILVKGQKSLFTYISSGGYDIELRIKIHNGSPTFKISDSFQFDFNNSEFTYILTPETHSDSDLDDYIHYILPYDDILNKYCNDTNDTFACMFFSYQIQVESNQSDSHYTINIGPKGKDILLREGLPETGVLKPKETQNYAFYSNELITNEEKFNVFIHSYQYKHKNMSISSNKYRIPITDIKFTKINQNIDNLRTRTASILRNITNPTENVIHYLIQAESGKYSISIENPYNFTLKFSIVIQSKELTVLSSEDKTYSLIEEDTKYYYEINLDDPGLLVIRVTQCFGSVLLRISDSYLNLFSNSTVSQKVTKGLEVVDHVEDEGKEIYILEIDKPSLIYVEIEFEDGLVTSPNYKKQTKEAYFKLTTQFIEQDNIDKFKLWRLGGFGKIQYHFENNFIATFIWTSPFYKPKNQKYIPIEFDKNIEYYYTLYYAKDKDYLSMVSRCGDILSSAGIGNDIVEMDTTIYSKVVQCTQSICQYQEDFTNEDLINSGISVKNDQFAHSQIVYATIRIDFKQLHEGYYNSEEYQIQEFQQVAPKRHPFFRILIFAIVPILLILVFILYKKYKNVKQKLDYEMQDVRNVAGIGRRQGYISQISQRELNF